MRCHYCVIYQTAARRVNKVVAKDVVVSERFCRCINETVHGETPICDAHFIVAQYFWCQRWGQWQHILACINQKKKGTPHCEKCFQCEEEIFEIAAGRNLYQLFGVQRRTIMEEVVSEQRPKLKLKLTDGEPTSKPKLKLRSEDDANQHRGTGSG